LEPGNRLKYRIMRVSGCSRQDEYLSGSFGEGNGEVECRIFASKYCGRCGFFTGVRLFVQEG
jgi:hypothetical protein